MSCADVCGSENITGGPPDVEPPLPPATRYHGLDGVRATAMLLGVFYHLPIAMMAGGMAFGFGFGFGSGGSPKTSIDNWLHSFRMPLFFLISGFFANMMLAKYGWRRYLARRWWRIGAPLAVAFVLLVTFRVVTNYFQPTGPGLFAFPIPGAANAPPGRAAGTAPAGPGFGNPGTAPVGPPVGGFGAPGTMPFGPPGGGFAAPGTMASGPPAAGFGMPGAAPFGPPPGGFGPPGTPPAGTAPGGFGAPGAAPFGPPGGFGPANPSPGAATVGGPAAPSPAEGGPAFNPPSFPSRMLADRLFGSYSHFVNLEHLWFLWYLLVFVTIGPLAVAVIAWGARPPLTAVTDRVGGNLIRYNLIAIVLGLVSLPALLHARGFMGWSLANPIGFLAPFPDFFYQYYADVPYYFLYFLAGWWLHRLRDRLPDFGRVWLWSLVLGIAGFAASQALADRYALRTDLPHFAWIRVGAFALYGTGAAYTVCAFLGFFQRYLDRPSRASRYFADTALWIYLIHLPLIPYLMWWIQPSRSAWWSASLAGMILVTGVALVAFELLVRPTPLVHIFGPPTRKGHTKG